MPTLTIRLTFLLLLGAALSWAQSAPCPSPIPGESCADACLTCIFTSVGGTTAGFGADGAPGFCASIENDQWFAFVANGSSLTFSMNYTNCTNAQGLEFAIYAGPCGSGGPVDCISSNVPGASGVLHLANVPTVAGQIYYIVIDGKNGDICNFTLQMTGNTIPEPQPLGAVTLIDGRSRVCPGLTVNYRTNSVTGAEYLSWTIPADATINGIPGPGPVKFSAAQGTSVNIKFGNTGGSISVTPSNDCRVGVAKSKAVTVAPIPVTNINATVCASELPYWLPWGEEAKKSGSYTYSYTSYIGCDSTVAVQLNVIPTVVRALGSLFACEGESVTVCNQTFSDPGDYSVTCRTGACDTTYVFNVARPPATILGGGSLNCFNNAVLLRAGTQVGAKIWRDSTGQVVGNADSVTITQPGKYTLEVVQSVNGKTCVSKASTTIKAVDVLRLSPLPGVGALTCAKTSTTLKFTTNMTAAVSGLGLSTNPALAHELNVTQGGLQTFTATTSGGCTATATVNIPVNTSAPSLTAQGGTLSCTSPNVTLKATSTVPGVTYQWTGPLSTFSSTLPELHVTTPGNYRVVVTDPANGCTNSSTVTVVDNNAPAIQANGDTIFCPQTSLQLSVNTVGNTTAPLTFSWTGPNGFSSSSLSPTVSVPGSYTVVATNPISGCTSSSVAVVTRNSTTFAVPAGIGGVLNCLTTAVPLSVPGLPTTYSYVWTGPNGFTSSQVSPSVSAPGTYTVSITDAAGGCKGATTAVVTQNINLPTAQATGGNLPCKPAAVTLNCSTNAVPATFQWSGPGGFISTLPNPVVNQAGSYRVTVTNGDGCTKTATASVNQYPGAPFVSISLSTLSTGQRRLNCTTTAFSPTYSWTGPNNFTSTLRNPIVADPGIYTVLVKDGITGCEVYRSYTVPVLRPSGDVNRKTVLAEGEWQLYPNPAQSAVQLRFDGPEAPADTRVRVLDAGGRLVLERHLTQQGACELNLERLSAGLYQVQVEADGATVVKTLIVGKE